MQTFKLTEPVTTYSAVELAKMPLSEMQVALAAQEKHVIAEAGIGSDARQALLDLRAGAVVRREKPKKRVRWSIGDKPVRPEVLRQLARRGYLDIAEIWQEQA